MTLTDKPQDKPCPQGEDDMSVGTEGQSSPHPIKTRGHNGTPRVTGHPPRDSLLSTVGHFPSPSASSHRGAPEKGSQAPARWPSRLSLGSLPQRAERERGAVSSSSLQKPLSSEVT